MRKLITIDEARRYANHADWNDDADRALNTNYERMLRAACALAIADLAIMQQPHGAATDCVHSQDYD